jgi:hypothetical protein
VKRLNPPKIRDEQILDILAANTSLKKTSYPHLKRQLQNVKDGYQDYLQNRGNAWQLTNPNLNEDLKTALVTHYKSPPQGVNYLEGIRNSSPEVCPMCGGFHPTTLDHILPKEDYPTWAIFSKNLVPACGCNMKRGTALKGQRQTQARILHPYFDDVLSARQLTTTITNKADFGWLKATISYVNDQHEQIESIKFHTINVVIKAGIENWFRGRLGMLKERPYTIIRTLPKREQIQLVDLQTILENCLDDHDFEFGTPNNWHSILLHGLLHAPHIHNWLVQTHNDGVKKL